LKVSDLMSVHNSNIDQLTPAQRKKIEADKDNLTLSKRLAEIYTEVPLNSFLRCAGVN
jgi:5'-3' exonuclease